MSLGSALFIILNEGLGLGVPKDVYWYLVGLAITYIVGEAAVDIKR